jgi:hypothetical protein
VRFPPDLWARIKQRVPARERSAFIRRAIERELEQAVPPKKEALPPIWERVQDLLAKVPPEDLERLPEDGSEQHDHYVYGTPKQPRK